MACEQQLSASTFGLRFVTQKGSPKRLGIHSPDHWSAQHHPLHPHMADNIRWIGWLPALLPLPPAAAALCPKIQSSLR